MTERPMTASDHAPLALRFTATANQTTPEQRALVAQRVRRVLGDDCTDVLEALEVEDA